jgi:hypothetical protein
MAKAFLCSARTNVTLRERRRHTESRSIYCIMAVEVFFGGVKARLPVLCAHDFLNHFSWTETLGRLGPVRRKQRNHLLHRTQDIAMGFHPRKFVLPRTLRRQSPSLAQS